MNCNPQIYPPLFGKNKTFRQKIKENITGRNIEK